MKCTPIPSIRNHVSTAVAESTLVLLKMVSGSAALLLYTKYGQCVYNTEHDWLKCSPVDLFSFPLALTASDIF